jgi:hypothetical protein
MAPARTETSERRTARRYPFSVPIDVYLNGDSGQRIVHGSTIDVSTSGMYFVVHLELPAGSQVEFQMALPTGSGREVMVRGRCTVVRSEKPEARVPPGVGIAAMIETYHIIKPIPET